MPAPSGATRFNPYQKPSRDGCSPTVAQPFWLCFLLAPIDAIALTIASKPRGIWTRSPSGPADQSRRYQRKFSSRLALGGVYSNVPSPVRFSVSTIAKHKKRRDERDLRRPFDARVLRRARAVAARYQIVLWREDGHWFGRGLEQPFTFGNGKTVQQAVTDTRKGLILAVASSIESGEPIVSPIVDRERRKAG